ncbi:hypothetical protein OsI_13533 [Oryza sativa Indica Group]|uniref:EF-hand domain-containing protein n=1 Tax=Oryza sativa subsp. indica TaxID=39946 RepID=B8AJX4_ORYSI|nr:hypothetical protein OsI_13533 [Oryza sativa Indica Group]
MADWRWLFRHASMWPVVKRSDGSSPEWVCREKRTVQLESTSNYVSHCLTGELKFFLVIPWFLQQSLHSGNPYQNIEENLIITLEKTYEEVAKSAGANHHRLRVPPWRGTTTSGVTPWRPAPAAAATTIRSGDGDDDDARRKPAATGVLRATASLAAPAGLGQSRDLHRLHAISAHRAATSPRRWSQPAEIQANPMDDNSIQQSLLADNPNVLQRKPSEGVNRFRRCRSTPSTDPLQGPPEKGSSVKAKELFKEMRPSFRLVGLLLFIYLLVGVLAFYAVMDEISGKRTNRVLDALYFCVVTMTTVGYGDLVPNNDTTKLLACAFVFMGMAVVALFVSKVADYLVEKQEVLFFKALHTNLKGGETKMLRAIETNRIKYKFYTNALLLVLSIISGTVFLWKVEKLSLVDSFYCVCATITTLGYGDKSFSSKLGRVFAVFWIITSTIIMAQFFMYLAEIYTERRQKMLANWVLTRKMTKMDLEAADLDDDRQVGAAEFVVYKLKELGKINQEEISSFLEEFEKLDVDHSGTLSPYDLTLAQSAQ